MTKNIKSIQSFRIVHRLDSIHDSEIQIKEIPSSYELFDENGNLIEEVNYSATGDLNEKYQYFYDENNWIIKKHLFLSEDEVAEIKTISRDENGNIQSYEIEYMDKSIDKADYSYENGLLKQILVEDEDGEISLKHEFNHDENSNVIWEKKQDEFGLEFEINRVFSDNLLIKEVKKLFREDLELESVFEYDNENQLIQKKTTANNGMVLEHSINEYDEKNRNSKSTIIDDDVKTFVFNKFDDDSNEVLQYAEDEAGNRVHKIEREFDAGLLKKSDVEIYGPENRLQTKYSIIKKYEFFEV